MADKYLFEKFGEDKRIYNLNQGYWKRKLQSRLKLKFSNENILFKNVDTKGKKIYDANPIFTFISYDRNKAIRIIQDDIKLLKDDIKFSENDLINAWIDDLFDFENSNSNEEIEKTKELVIALFLTKDTVEKTMKLIVRWINTDNLNSEEIEQILNE